MPTLPAKFTMFPPKCNCYSEYFCHMHQKAKSNRPKYWPKRQHNFCIHACTNYTGCV